MDEMDPLEASTVTEDIYMEDLVTDDLSSPEDPLVNLTKPQHQMFQSLR